jgi:hypothetical protein
MEIRSASYNQVLKGRGGRMVLIDDDVCGIAAQLLEIDPSLRLRWSEAGEYFVVYQQIDEHTRHLVTTAQELDGRLLQRVLKITHPDFDFAAEVDRIDAEADAAIEHRFHEGVGERGERLAHAVRKDMGFTNRAFVPECIEPLDAPGQKKVRVRRS